MRIFISYRRDDSGHVVDRIHERLCREFDPDAIFMDLDAIPLGVNFRQAIADALVDCRVVLAVIGSRWLTAGDPSGVRRLTRDDDLVRIEIETALSRGIPVVPVLIEGAAVPDGSELPATIAPLSNQNGMAVRRGSDFSRDMDRLVGFLRGMGLLGGAHLSAPNDHPFDLLGMF
jgi:hypothetical protein